MTLEKLQMYYACDPTTALIPKTSKTSPVSVAFFHCLTFSLVLWLLTSTFTAFLMFLWVFGCLVTGLTLPTTASSQFLPTLSNILERAVHLQLYQYLITNNLLSNKQFGFRKGFSTTTALTSFADEVLLNMEQGKLCGAMFIDLTKAFDTVDHQIMLCKLSKIGLSETALHWFRSHLTGRQQ